MTAATLEPQVSVESIPDALRTVPRWLCWRYGTRDGKLTKTPRHPETGKLIDVTCKANLVPFATAAAHAEGYDGLGFALGEGFAGIDLDDCFAADGKPYNWAQYVLDDLGTYAERSPSGSGIKLFLRGEKPEGRCRRDMPGGHVEMYGKERYFSVTGRRYDGAPAEVQYRDRELKALHAMLFAPRAERAAMVPPQRSVEIEDADLIARAMAARNGPAFTALWSGDTSAYGGDDSRADLALCSHLAFWAGDDPPRIDALFRRSGLHRAKWERADYREATIAKALEGATEFYTSAPSSPEGAESEALCDEPTDAERRILALPRTDAGNAEALAHFYGYRLKYDHKRGRWLVFGKHHWRPDGDGELVRLCKRLARLRHAAALKITDKTEQVEACKWARGTESRQKIDAALTLARAEAPVADRGEGWDSAPFLLGVPNGVVDLRTGTLREGRPEDRITQIAAAPFDPQATCPRWERFLGEVLSDDDELVAFLHRALGYSATGDMRERCFLILYGGGSNGKSVLLAQVRSVLGDLAADTPFTTFELNARSGIPADLAALEGRRFVTASETAEHCRLNEARIKAWTGQDPCTARLLHENFRTFQPVGKLWLCTNHRPRVEDDSEGFWQRVRLVPFRRQFRADDDPELQDTLRAEATGILRWIVEGARLWFEGGLQAPTSVLAAGDEWRAEADPVAEFLAACCVLHPEESAQSAKLFAAYEAWAQIEGLRDRERLTATAFGRRMGVRFVGKRTEGGKRYYGVGLRLTG